MSADLLDQLRHGPADQQDQHHPHDHHHQPASDHWEISKLNLSRPSCCFLACGKGSWRGVGVGAESADGGGGDADAGGGQVLVLEFISPGFLALW